MISINDSAEINKMIEDFRSGGSKQELEDYLKSKLNREQSNRLNEILHDDRALSELLSSKKAQELLKKLTGGKNG